MKFKQALLPRHEFTHVDTPQGRYYPAPDGGCYRSVTTRIGDYFGEPPHIAAWRDRVGHEEADRILHRAGRRGRALHGLLELYLQNKPIGSPMPNLAMDFATVKPALDKHVSGIFGLELPLWSSKLKTAGRADLVAVWDGVPAVVDFKTARSQDPKSESDILSYFIQVSAYAQMLGHVYGVEAPRVVILLTNRLDKAQVFVKGSHDYDDWLAKVFT